ncbi:MAG: GHMP kinase [Proteobacteria bacterium]|nr:GHMP kinase [Pseudomonadota bacterium]
MLIHSKAYARAGLIGNPSDGYFGKTLSFVFKNFYAEVDLYQTPELEILGNDRDHSRFSDMEQLVDDVATYGYYGGIRLLKATVKRFSDYCRRNGIRLDKRNFSVRYRSSIPHQVGLAGSSAIITACLRALMSFYQVTIPKPSMAELVLKVETEELGISAGLQDRVVQVYEGLVYMDFDRELMERNGHGNYENLDISLLPPLYIAYLKGASEGSEVFHNNIRERFDGGDRTVVEAMQFWADLTVNARNCLVNGSSHEMGELINRNFDKRRSIYKIGRKNIQMIEAARSVGASAKFTGSGGAIVGTYRDDDMFEKLAEKLEPLQICIFKPDITPEQC